MGFLDKFMEKQNEYNEKQKEKVKDKIGEYSLDSSKKEIQELSNILNECEECKYLTSGFAIGDTWIIAITTNRLIFLHKKFNGEIKEEERNINDVRFCKFKSGFANGKIEIGLNDEYIIIKNIYKDYVKGMFNSIVEERVKYIMNENNTEYEEAKLIWDNISKEYENNKIKEELKLKEEQKEKKKQEYEKARKEYEEKKKAKEEEKRNEKQYQKDRLKQLERDHIPYCPKCKSTSLTYQNKKLSVGRAVVGGAIMGPVGAAVGGLTSKKGYVKCLNCGHKWKL